MKVQRISVDNLVANLLGSIVTGLSIRFGLVVALVMMITHAMAGHYAKKPLNPPSFPKNPYGGTIYFGYGSAAYGAQGIGYGASTTFNSPVSCQGAITTEYVWIRDQISNPSNPNQMIDDPIDIPPLYVISEEYCYAYSESYFFGPNGGYASSSNGLGFPEQIGSEIFRM